jgi:hypothetical protein
MRQICELFVPRVKLPCSPSAQKLGQDRTVLVPTHAIFRREEHRHRFPKTNFSFRKDRKQEFIIKFVLSCAVINMQICLSDPETR